MSIMKTSQGQKAKVENKAEGLIIRHQEKKSFLQKRAAAATYTRNQFAER